MRRARGTGCNEYVPVAASVSFLDPHFPSPFPPLPLFPISSLGPPVFFAVVGAGAEAANPCSNSRAFKALKSSPELMM